LAVESAVEADEVGTTAKTEETASTTTTETTSTSDNVDGSIEDAPRKPRKVSMKGNSADASEESSKSSTKSTDSKTSPAFDETQLEPVQLNSRNFGQHISDGNIWLIEFYSPHCSHCVEFASSYADIARYYHSQSIRDSSKKKTRKPRFIQVGKVNGEVERALVSRFSINAYPCFFLIDGFRVYKYDGLRLKKNLMAYVEGGYKKDATVPFIESPMGPLGIFQGTLMSTGHVFLDIFQWSQDTLGLSPLLVGMILFGVMFMGCFFIIVSLAMIIPEKPKRA
jgi:thiol-disulfide isomerase/thioredoxin